MMQQKKDQQEPLRYERKYLISDYDFSEVEQFIKFHPACFSEIFQKRKVNNIYFDTLGMNNYHDNLDGQQMREKTRVRWYGHLTGSILSPVLEYKIKNGLLGYKQSFQLAPFTLDTTFNKNDFFDAIRSSNLPVAIMNELFALTPTLLNSYERKYFLSADKKFRITIDHRLDYFHIDYFQNLLINKYCDRRSTVLELKYDAISEEDANKISTFFPFPLTKNSKYLQGLEYTFL